MYKIHKEFNDTQKETQKCWMFCVFGPVKKSVISHKNACIQT